MKLEGLNLQIVTELVKSSIDSFKDSPSMAERLMLPILRQLSIDLTEPVVCRPEIINKPVEKTNGHIQNAAPTMAHIPPSLAMRTKRPTKKAYHQYLGPAIALLADGLKSDAVWAEMDSAYFPSVWSVRSLVHNYRQEIAELSTIPPGSQRYAWLQKTFGMGIPADEWQRILANRRKALKAAA